MFEMGQETLFGKRIISSIGFDEQQILRDILNLHCNGKPIDCDPTYSIGNFYKHGLPKPKWKFDIDPQCEGVERASADKLPLKNGSIYVMMFDPPFLFKNRQKPLTDKISTRFKTFKTWKEMIGLYDRALKEFKRVVCRGGIVIFKCQDVADGLNYQTHCEIMYLALKNGFYPKDLFVLLNPNKDDITNYNGGKQKHARKHHSYFWVFENKASRVCYGITNNR